MYLDNILLNIKREDTPIGTFRSYKGFYKPKNPTKYKGDPTNCIYRSLWERRFMQYCDLNESIVGWSSEEVVVPYWSPLDNKPHRYYVDFWVKTMTAEGKEECMLIEIKPRNKTSKPELGNKKMTRAKLNEMRDWIINSSKWEAAEKFCQSRGWKFKVLTEKDIFGRGKERNTP